MCKIDAIFGTTISRTRALPNAMCAFRKIVATVRQAPVDLAPVELHSNLFECISTGAEGVAWGRGAPWGSTGMAAEILRQEAVPGISPRLQMGLAPLPAACASND